MPILDIIQKQKFKKYNTDTKNELTRYKQKVIRKWLRARTTIEPTISHLKRNQALVLNFIKGVTCDIHIYTFSRERYNLKFQFNQIKEQILFWLQLTISF